MKRHFYIGDEVKLLDEENQEYLTGRIFAGEIKEDGTVIYHVEFKVPKP